MTRLRSEFFVVTFLAVGVLLTTATSCRKAEREEVPNPQKPQEEQVQRPKQAEPNEVEQPAEKPEQIEQVNPAEEPVQNEEEKPVREEGPAHGPERKCETCHGKQDETQIASAEVKLIARLSDLCLGCHPEADYSSSREVVHGPLAVAECLFCHDPHVSKNEHLLKKLAPELCYGCHEKKAVEAIPDHLDNPECLSCHLAHSSSKKALLK